MDKWINDLDRLFCALMLTRGQPVTHMISQVSQ